MPQQPPSHRPEEHVATSSCTNTCKACHCLSCLVFEGVTSVRLCPTLREEVNIPRFDGQTPLMIASNLGKADVVQVLLEAGADADVAVQGKGTALLQAVGRGHTDVVRLLVDYGADMYYTNGKVTALHDASSKGHWQIIRELHRAGMNLDTKNKSGGTAVHYAIQQKRMESLKTLIELGADLRACAEPSSFNGVGITPLNLAAMNGDTIFLRVLLEEGGLDPNEEPTNGGGTALALAIHSGNLESVKLLLEKGADANKITLLPTRENGTDHIEPLWPVSVAVDIGNLNILKLLVEYGAVLHEYHGSPQVTRSTIHKAAFSGNTELVRYIVERGVDAKRIFEKGETVLHKVAVTGKVEMLKLLLELGCDVNFQNSLGFTAVERAAANGKLESVSAFIAHGGMKPEVINGALEQAVLGGHCLVVKELLVNGADPNIGSALPPIYSAVSILEEKAEEVVSILVAYGAKIGGELTPSPELKLEVDALPTLTLHQVTDNYLYIYKNRISPLHVAVGRGLKSVAKLLIKLGFDIDITDSLGATPLHVACCHSQGEASLALIKWGANIHIPTHDFETPLHIASMNGLTETVAELVRGGANLTERTKGNKTALMLSLERGHTNTANKLIELSNKDRLFLL